MASVVREWQSYRKGNKGDTSGNETPEYIREGNEGRVCLVRE